MKTKIIAILTACAVFSLFSSVVTGNASDSQRPFAIVFIGQISAKGQKAAVVARVTRSRIDEVQHLLSRDPGLVYRLRARGIEIKNVVGHEEAINGKTIFYIR